MPKSPPPIDLDNTSDAQLLELLQQARRVLADRFFGRVEEWRAHARDAGYELIVTKLGAPIPAGRPIARAIAAKYRNPDNELETWAGRGRMPNWIDRKLKAGWKLEEFRIPTAGSC